MTAPLQPTPDEIADFHAAIEGTVPLRASPRVVFEPPKPKPRPRQRELDEAAAITESLQGSFEIDDLLSISDTFLRHGLPRNLLRDLRRGRWAIQNHLDLHGLNRHEARDEVSRFLVESRHADKRCLRIVHGRGRGSPGREGILKHLVKNWLSRHRDVLAFCQAPSVDGGEGALWVLLRGNREAREARR